MMTRPASLLLPVALFALLPALQPRAQAQAAPSQAPAAQAAAPAGSQGPTKEDLQGVRNFTRVDATFACGGAFTPSAAAGVKQAGFRSVVNLRAAAEEGANVEAEKAAVEGQGLTYIWLPFVTASPDAATVDAFVQAVRDPANQPMLLHCTSGGRASMFWAVKRVVVDGWPIEKAMNELPDLSKRVSEPLRNFILDYLKQHAK